MHDCADATMRDWLPDLLHDRVPEARVAELTAHLESCPACRGELAVLRRVRTAAVTPRVDVGRIVAALPPYRVHPVWRRAVASPYVRIAAAVVLMAGLARIGFHDGFTVGPSSVDSSQRIAVARPAEVALGATFHDLTDADLVALARELGELDAVMSDEPDDIVVPLTDGTGT